MTSELSNALNPRAAQPRARTRQRQPEADGPALTTGSPNDVGQRTTATNYIPHRSELELAIIPPEQPQTAVRTPTVTSRQALNTVQELLHAVVSQNAAIQAERVHRVAWEQEQEAKQSEREAELQSQLAEMRSELLLLKASVSMQTHSGQPLISEPLPDTYQPPLPEPTAYIEEITSPMMQEQRVSQPQPSPAPSYLAPPLPAFVQGSSSTPLSTPGSLEHLMHNPSIHDMRNPMLPSPTLSEATTEPAVFSPIPPQHAQPQTYAMSPVEGCSSSVQPLPPMTALPSPAQSPVSCTSPVFASARPQTPNSHILGKRRTPPSPASDYSSEESDRGSTSGQPSAPRVRKNGHDRRCLTIQHAMRVHLLKSLRIRSGEPLPESHDESEPIPADAPVRFVWEKTVKKCPHNAAMKTRVLKDLVARRKRYKDVPDKDFEKKVLDTAFEQAFTTLRQKYKMQKDDSSALQYRRREDQKYLKTRRKERKKAKSTTRTDRRAKLGVFSHPTFDPALDPECMSSEESCDEYVEEEYPTGERHRVQIFNIRGPIWRSSRLIRFYAILDAEEAAEQEQMQLLNSGTGSSSTSTKPRKVPTRKERRLGPPKDGFIMPPRGVASWMVSRRWIRENCITRPDFEALLAELVQDSDGFDWEAFDLLGGESEDEVEEREEERFIPRSDTSSLAYALAPPA